MCFKIWATVAIGAVMFAGTSVNAKKLPLVSREEVGPLPTNLLEPIQSAAQHYLKDPASANYELGELYPGYCKEGWLKGSGIAWKGWAVNVMVNARNAYGGYTGFQPHTALFSGNKVVRLIEGENFGAYGPSKGILGLEGGAGVCQIIKK